MTLIQYILSDKKARPYWVFLYILLIPPLLASIIMYIRSEDEMSWDPIGLMVMLFGVLSILLYYLPGYLNIMKRQRFRAYYHFTDDKQLSKSPVIIEQASYDVTALKTNYHCKITPNDAHTKLTIFQVNKKLVFWGSVYDMGIFRRDTCPIVIDDTDTKFKYAKCPKIKELRQSDHGLHITFQRPIFGIKAITFKALHLHYENTSSGNSPRIKFKNHICEV